VDDYNELPRDFPRRNDVLVALKAVRKACQITNGLQPGTAKEGISTVEKSDASPVTVGDFACQASVRHDLHMAFPEDSFIAEESSSALDDDDELAKQILVATALSDMQQVKQSVDLGKDYLHWEERGKRPPRVWCLDPIDGTRGFLRGKRQGGQYCVALALLEVRFLLCAVLTDW
jgi:3'-phosphoadenosine 5'-phosphosulfate (PAPS) 3'-phosphatase